MEMPQETMQEDTVSNNQEATPEEQAQYDAIVTKALELMYGKDSHEAVVERMQSFKGSLPIMLGTLAANLARAGVQELRSGNQQVDDEIVAYAGFEIIAELIDLAQALKLMPKDGQEESVGHQAMYVAIRKYTEMAAKSGETTPEDADSAKQALQQFQGGQQEQPQQQSQPQQPQGLMANG